MSKLFKGRGIEINLAKKDSFHIIVESLTRIGTLPIINDTGDNILEQSCHILHKKDKNGNSKYAILHFKEMYEMDGFPSKKNDIDLAIRNKVVKLLEQWKLIEPVGDIGQTAKIDLIKIVTHADKKNWHIKQKYRMRKQRES